MFCARCWAPVGSHDRVCGECEADLLLPGSVRLTDPRRLADPPTPARPPTIVAVPVMGSQVAPAVDAGQAADVVVGEGAATPHAGSVGPGWWSRVRGKLVKLGEKAAVANRAGSAEPPAAQAVGASQPPGEQQAPDASQPMPEPPTPDTYRSTPEPPGEPQDAPALGPPAQSGPSTPRGPVASGTDNQPEPLLIDGPDSVAAGALIKEPTPARSARPLRPRRPKGTGELNLWDDYGITDAHEWFETDDSAPARERVSHLLGASVVPTAKTFSFLLVLGGAVVMLILLVSLLLNLDNLFFTPPSSEATPAAPSATTAPPEPTAEPEPQTEQSPLPSIKHTPEMLPGARECLPGVWAGQQTSCPLAEAVAAQVDLKMTDSRIVEAHSPVTDRTYRLECVADGGITCTGLDGVVGVYVWFVTES